MTISTSPMPTSKLDIQRRFENRARMLSDPNRARQTAEKIKTLLESGNADAVRSLLREQYPPDIADILGFLDDVQDRAVFKLLDVPEAAEVLDEVDECTRGNLVEGTPPERLAQIVQELPSDEGTDIVQAIKPDEREHVLALLDPAVAVPVRQLLAYPQESAGGIMSLGYVTVPDTGTLGDALRAFQEKGSAESVLDIYVVDANNVLKGWIDLRDALREDANSRVIDYLHPTLVTVPPERDREQVARIFARYDLNALPVVESDGKLVGIITADDIIDVIEAEVTEDMMRMAGSDAEEMERRSPARTALLRLPWIMATMFIELGAGVVIHFYDTTLARVLLLASFMPIISAISGNTGLQSATIIVRGLSTGQVQVATWRHALVRQLVMTLILGTATGLALGTIGAIWYGKWTFGLVVFVGMFAAVNIAGVVGTVVPLMSKRLGFDPAITSGPFETAFQDVVGISIFLTLATILLRFLT